MPAEVRVLGIDRGALAVVPTDPADFPIEGDPVLPLKDRPVIPAAIMSGADVPRTDPPRAPTARGTARHPHR